MSTRFLSGKGRIFSPSGYLSTVIYKIEAKGQESNQGSIRVLSGEGGLRLHDHEGTLTLQLDDGFSLSIVIKTPIDLTDDSWHILVSS